MDRSLYYWWFAPLDLAAILLVTPLYLFASRARLGYGVNGLFSGLEAIALVYFGLAQLELPFASFGKASAAWVGVALIFVRLIIGRAVVAHSERLVFIAGGVGVTPMLSILRALAERDDTRRIRLIWSNRTRADRVHPDVVKNLERSLPGLQTTHIFTREAEAGCRPEGITPERLEELLGPYQVGTLVFLCGPSEFMRRIKDRLLRLGYPRRTIKTETFRM